MSHNLEQKNGKTSIVSGKGITPWHHLGKVLPKSVTAKDALRHGGLDFEVEKFPCFAQMKQGLVAMPEKYVTVRTDSTLGLGVVGERYQIVQNRDAFAFFDEITEKGEATYETAGVLGRGEKVWLLANLEDLGFSIGADMHKSYLLLYSTHDGTGGLQIRFVNTRVVCANTVAMAFSEKDNRNMSIRHTGDVAKKMTEAAKIIASAKHTQKEVATYLAKFLATKLTEKQIGSYFDKVLKIDAIRTDDISSRKTNEKDILFSLSKSGLGIDKSNRGTLFSAYCAVTEYTTHHRTVKGEGEDKTQRLVSMIGGRNEKLNLRAYANGIALVG